MKNKKAMIASLALVGAIGVGATLAYLSDQSNILTNSFTVGQGYVEDPDLGQAVWVDEKDYDGTQDEGSNHEKLYYYVDPDGLNELRTLKGNDYGTASNKLEAGSLVTKDPVIRLTEDSIDSWVYMQVTYKKDDAYSFVKGDEEGKNLEDVIDKNEWVVTKNSTDNNMVTVEVRYKKRLNSSNPDEEANLHNTTALFDAIKIDETFTGTPNITNITIKACAVQAVYTKDGQKVYLAPADETSASERADGPTFG